ncbi:MAG: hypothetical protein COA96_17110 [SAR86 cluster bacterium]|uniref:DUF3108 domain-containing protein n=1 Tax=SAR86 cluster bacterium TaxID=2030880 RepID=A0A2A5AFN5_9GAMM|nr:MAG: hypothetical protein COA96_17110 [SAR86 cluster bacterium]
MKLSPKLIRLFLVLIICVVSTSSSFGQQVLEYSAHYQATANGIAATAQRSLTKLSDYSFRLTNRLQASIAGQTLATLEQSSEFEFVDDTVKPSIYSYVLTGISKAANAIAYNWDAQIALSTEDEKSWQLPLSSGVMDQLSYQFALRQFLISGNTASDVEFQVIDGDEIELHRYRIAGDALLSTPLGNLNTVKLERLRDTADGRTTTIWLAVDWDFLLARIEQVNRSGLKIELQLESALVGGVNVSALK